MLKIVKEAGERQGLDEGRLSLDAIAREGARQMLVTALEAEVADYIGSHKCELDDSGHRQVVRNGHGKARHVTVGSGTFAVQSPRVNDRREGKQFTSKILPPYIRRSPKVEEVLPVLYLRGLSTGDFKPALTSLLGEKASGLSSTTITRLTKTWQSEYREFRNTSLEDKDYVYVWVDGVHFNVRLDDERLCTLVVMGTLADGTKELIAVEDGFRESKASWASVLRDLTKRRKMKPPLLVIGDGALGFWAAVRDVWPQTKEQRCWVHKIANVLDKLPKSMQPKAKSILHDIMKAPDEKEFDKAVKTFSEEFKTKYAKAVTCLEKDQEKLKTFYDFPAEQWSHIRTCNPIESAFATVRLRQRVTKGAGSRDKALLMAFKLLDMAQLRWRKLKGYRQMEKLNNGIKFEDGIEVKNQSNQGENAAA